jgi:hypothetical protein
MFVDDQTPRPDAAERTERHLRLLAEILEGAAELIRDEVQTARRRRAATAAAEAAGLPPPTFARPAGPAGSEPADLFCRLFDRVCRGIVLEAKVAGQRADAERDRRRERRIEPRRARMRQILHEAVVVRDGASREAALQTIDDALEDPEIEEMLAEGALVGDVVVAVCCGFDITVDDDRLPDEALRSTRTLPFPYRSSAQAQAQAQAPAHAQALGESGPDPP